MLFIMPFKDKNTNSCGYLDWLDSTDFTFKVRRFVLLKEGRLGTLELYFANSQKHKLYRPLDLNIRLTEISWVSRYKSYKVKNVFYLVVNGDKMFFAGENDRDTQGWCDVIQANISMDGNTNTHRKLTTSSSEPAKFYSDTSVSHIIPRKRYDFSSWNVIKTGNCKKKSGSKFAWQERYFVLNADGLTYFTCDLNLRGFIKNEDILTCRKSIGVYPDKKEIFEIVTRKKVYYCLVKTENEKEEWINCINSNKWQDSGGRTVVTHQNINGNDGNVALSRQQLSQSGPYMGQRN